MDNPQGQLTQSTIVFQRTASTKGDGGSYLVRVCPCEVEGAIAAKAHAQHIDPRMVELIVLLHPFQNLIELMRVPPSSRVLRSDNQGGNHESHLSGIDRAVAQYPVEVTSAETGAMKEEDKRGGLLGVVIFLRGIYPEIIVAFDDPFLC